MTASKVYLAWIGQNATTGTPHHLTDRLSMYGNLRAFSTKEQRNNFVSEFRSFNPSVFCVKTSVSRAKVDYFGGISKDLYDEIIKMLEVDIAVE